VAGPFGLEGQDHWEAPFKTKDAVQRRLIREGKDGVFVDAPARVPLDGRTALPVVGCRLVSLRDAKKVSFDRGAIVTAVHLDDGRLHAGLVHASRTRDPSAPKPEEDATDPGEGTFVRMFKLDAHERLPDLPWRAGTIVTTLLLRGDRSERQRSLLAPPPPRGWVDPVVAEAAAAAPPVERGPVKVSRLEGATWKREARSPQAPEAPGLALSLLKRAQAKGSLVVRGTFTVPLLEHQVVKDHVVGDPEAKAVVPVGLLLTGEESAGPFVVELGVPIYELPPAGAPAKGHFTLDLLTTKAMSHRKAQKYWLWAFVGEALSGPTEVVLT
jgi:hypothetical protein